MITVRPIGPAMFFLVVLLVLSAYLPGTNGELLLDDIPSLSPLEKLISEPQYFWDEVFGNNTGPLGRSVSMFSFAIDYAVFDGSSATLKRHSIFLHILNAFLIVWLTYLLLAIRKFDNACLLASFAGAFWLVAPQHTSTVLYVVQRMAMLSTMFTLIALICFLKFRASDCDFLRPLWLFGSLVSISLAPFAKENGIVVIPLIVLMELLWVRGSRLSCWFQSTLQAVLTLLICACLAASFIFIGWDWIEAGYEIRQFTLEQRLLTQGVVILDYVKQFYLPDLSLLSIYHDDFPVSQSLLSEPRTLFSWVILVVIFVLASLGLIAHKCVELVFAIGAFLVCHSIESTILALEIYFEHRNYLPSVFLAMMPCFAVAKLVRWTTVEALQPLVALGGVWVIYLLLQTSSQVQIWSNNSLLALHMLNGHPGSARANTTFARNLARLGDYTEALDYSERAFNNNQDHLAARGERDADMRLRNVALACISGQRTPENQIEMLGLHDQSRPISEYIILELYSDLIRDEICSDLDWAALSSRLAWIFLSRNGEASASMGVYMRLAAFENALDNFSLADRYALLALNESPHNVTLLLMRLHFLVNLDKFDEAILVRRQLEQLNELGLLDLQHLVTLEMYPKRSLTERLEASKVKS
ncbi:MAG: hypothetical protein ABJ056_05245 [Halioglobus sp.]